MPPDLPGYDRRPCSLCHGSGRRYDITLADNVKRPADYGTCSKCQGAGHTLHINAAGRTAERIRWEAAR